MYFYLIPYFNQQLLRKNPYFSSIFSLTDFLQNLVMKWALWRMFLSCFLMEDMGYGSYASFNYYHTLKTFQSSWQASGKMLVQQVGNTKATSGGFVWLFREQYSPKRSLIKKPVVSPNQTLFGIGTGSHCGTFYLQTFLILVASKNIQVTSYFSDFF